MQQCATTNSQRSRRILRIAPDVNEVRTNTRERMETSTFFNTIRVGLTTPNALHCTAVTIVSDVRSVRQRYTRGTVPF